MSGRLSAGALLLFATAGCGDGFVGEVRVDRSPSPSPSGYRALASVPDAGSLSGLVSLVGPVPQMKPHPVTQDKAACGAADHPNLTLVLGAGNAVANAVVALQGVSEGKSFAPASAALDQKGCEFVPHVQVVPVGATIAILNSDAVNHNVHAYDSANESLFNIGTPLQGMRVEQRLVRPGPVRIKCDVHPWMSGWLYAAETPYAAVTGPDGRYTLSDVPPGTYRITVWHELLSGADRQVTVPPKGTATLDLPLSVSGG